jgi:hypothetical protein
VTPFNVCPAAGGEHEGTETGATGVYEQPPLTQLPGDWWHTSGGLVQSLPVQQFATGMHVLPQSLSPPGHAHPDALHCSPPLHAGRPLHVQPPDVHVLVVVAVQSLSVQQLVDGMHTPSHSFSFAGHAQPAPVHTCPPVQAIEPLHVHVPPLQVFVVDVMQSPAVQQLADGMHAAPQSR